MISSWQQLAELDNPGISGADIETRQRKWLLECLKRNRTTRYGKTYNFENIKSVEDFTNHVPLVHYEDILSYIEQITQGKEDVLFRGPVVAFEKTSGSSGNEKLIPYSQESLRDFRFAILPWLANTARHYGIRKGSVYWAFRDLIKSNQKLKQIRFFI